MPSQPPPLPSSNENSAGPKPLEYRQTAPPIDPSRRVFDRVAGPNLRLRDNLIQLACAIAGGAAGAFIGSKTPVPYGVALGAILGMVIWVFVSGLAIGLIRFFKAGR
jgi:hypothetical protein